MAIQETLTTGASATSKALYEQSIVHITGTFEGQIFLQMTPDGTTDWLTFLAFEDVGTVPISTPDATMDYRFLVDLSSGSAKVYLGA